MNSVNLVGRLVRDPELRYTNGNNAYVRFTLAVDRRLSKEKRQEAEAKNQPTADFISCVAWGKTAETIANYLSKGSQIGIDGKIQTGSYEKDDGTRVYTTDVLVTGMTFVGNRNSTSRNTQSEPSGFYPVDDEEIPF